MRKTHFYLAVSCINLINDNKLDIIDFYLRIFLALAQLNMLEKKI